MTHTAATTPASQAQPAPKPAQLPTAVVPVAPIAPPAAPAPPAQAPPPPPIARPCGCVVGVPRGGVSAAGVPIFSRDELAWPPSVRRGMSLADEHNFRQQGCTLIQKLGETLGVPQLTIATGSLYFHVFYTRLCFQEHDWELMAMTALFLAGKVEDSRTPIKVVLSAFYKYRGTTVTEQEMEAQKERVFRQELILLDAIEYNFFVTHPYSFLHQIIRDFGTQPADWKSQYLRGDLSIVKVAWLFSNDSMRTNANLVHDPQTVAVGCVFFALEFKEAPQPTFPGPDGEPIPWYTALYGVTDAQIYDIAVRLLCVLPATLLQKVTHLIPRAAQFVPYPLMSLLPTGTGTPALPPPPAPSASPVQPRRRGQFPTALTSAASTTVTTEVKVTVVTETKDPVASTPAPVDTTAAPAPATPAPPPPAPSTPAPPPPTANTPATQPDEKKPQPKRPHAATGPTPPPPKKHPERQPCPRCSQNLTKQEYEAHRDACKAKFNSSRASKNGTASTPSKPAGANGKAAESKASEADDPFMGAGRDPKRVKSSHRSSDANHKRPRESSSKKPQSSPSKEPAPRSSSASSSAERPVDPSTKAASGSSPTPNGTHAVPSPIDAPMNGTSSTDAAAPAVPQVSEVNDVEMSTAEASAAPPVAANGAHVPANQQRQSPHADPHPDLSLSAGQPRDRDPDGDGAEGGPASQKPVLPLPTTTVSHTEASDSNGGSAGSNGAGNSDSLTAESLEARLDAIPEPPHSVADNALEDESGSPRSLKRRKAANGSASELPLPSEDVKEEITALRAISTTDDWESTQPIARDELNGVSPATRHLESDDSNMDSQLGSPPAHAFSTSDAVGTFFVPLNGDVNHAAAATRNEHYAHITSSPMVATNQN